jgi:uncharacterized membrane protein
MDSLKINCKACDNEKSMEATKISRFSVVVQVIGWLLSIPSILGVLIAIVSIATYVFDVNDTTILGISGVWISITFGVISLIAGLLGYILIMKKKVFKYSVCGFVMDRA